MVIDEKSKPIEDYKSFLREKIDNYLQQREEQAALDTLLHLRQLNENYNEVNNEVNNEINNVNDFLSDLYNANNAFNIELPVHPTVPVIE